MPLKSLVMAQQHPRKWQQVSWGGGRWVNTLPPHLSGQQPLLGTRAAPGTSPTSHCILTAAPERRAGGVTTPSHRRRDRGQTEARQGWLTENCPVGSISKQSEGQTIVNVNEGCGRRNESDMLPALRKCLVAGKGSKVKDILILI